MCGGEGTRLESVHEKPLHPIADVPMIDRVIAALSTADRVETIVAAVSPNAPETRNHLEDGDLEAFVSGLVTDSTLKVVDTPGDGYVTDLQTLLDRPDLETPVLTVVADLPLLEGDVLDGILSAYSDSDASWTVCVPQALKRRLGASVESRYDATDRPVPTGVNVVGTDSRSMTHVHDDYRLAVNVNRLEDAELATRLLDRQEGD
ncbi:NTP transferase domain-containing protein [Natrialba sp. INN-245]|uniref:NTP transferase domain-containing protein n=1 Tax=Natrialba sp. INN-245 TaxID=2690967 RepID=UPI0013110B4C|nr:NTP transferase domain-containing protein [Natrialba sp. INN-245]MWV40152.1 NTP transferase domain-containing protein [Natrialba sp. INN-245]